MAYQSQEETLKSLQEVISSLEMVAEELKNKIPPTGITPAAGSIPVTLAPDGATNTRLSTIYDFLVAQLQNKIPVLPKGTNTPENCVSVTLSPTGALVKSFGLTTDLASNSDTATTSFLSFFKYFLQRFSLFVDGIEVNGNASSANGIAIAPTDVHVYNTAVLQVTTSTVFTGSFVVQGSNDGTSWYNLIFEDLTSTQTSATRLTSASTSGLYNIPRLAKFIRVQLASLTAGSISAKMIAKK